jgi:hypothetical protein
MMLNPRDPSADLFPGWITMSYYYDRDYASAVAMANTDQQRVAQQHVRGLIWQLYADLRGDE